MNMKLFHRQYLLASCLPLLLAGCLAGGGGQDPDPLVQDYGIAYVMRPVVTDANGDPVPAPDARRIEDHVPGGDLYYRDLASPSAPVRNITGALTGGIGDVKDVEVSYDGTKLLFSVHLDEPNPNDPFIDQEKWNVFEYEIATDTLRPVHALPDGITLSPTADAGDDVAPHYLPDGRIIFSSNRQRRFGSLMLDEGKALGAFNALDENRAEHAMMLHVMDADGSNILQRSMNMSHDLDAVVRNNPLHDGKVLFSRWDNMGGRSQMSLYQANPDGSALEIVYGAHSHATGTNNSTIQFLQPREMPDGRIMTIMRPFNGSQGGGDLVLIDTDNYIDNTFPTAINAGILFGPAQTPATANLVTTDGSISPGGRFASAWPLDDGTNRALVSWSSCRVDINTQILPCTPTNLADPAAVEADPIYGIFIYDMDNNTQIPIVPPQEGFEFTDVVAVSPKLPPNIIFDAQPGAGLEATANAADAGILNIRSVYDLDGVDNVSNLNPNYADIAAIADPDNWPINGTTNGPRPARFLRIVKGVGIPDNDTKQIPGTAYGASAQQLMREIVAYAPVQPDGSVRTYVPANVPLAISVVDGNGRRISARHQGWLQFRAGEEVTCNGCHDHGSGTPHGHPAQPLSAYAGAPGSGWPNTLLRDVYGFNTMNPNDPVPVAINIQESMAEAITRAIPQTLTPSIDPVYDDYWTNINTHTQEAGFTYDYAALSTPAPETAACNNPGWTSLCRSVIHYETHIHPLWSVSRGAGGVDTCINCHAGATPAAELDLSDGAAPLVPEHFEAYRELLFADQIPDPVDPVNNPPITIFPSMSVAGANASNTFFSRFDAGGTHAGFLTPEELRLVAEWLDIGAQYYNDPSVVP